jgi:hypothetical protein
MASVNQRQYAATLASCSHALDNMIKLSVSNPALQFMCHPCKTLKDDISDYISVVTAEDNLTNKDRDDIFSRLMKMGGLWDEKEMTAEGCLWFCSGALNIQLDKIEGSKKLKQRAAKTKLFIDEFDGMAWTLEALYGNEDAEKESIEMLETYNLYMG